MKAGTKLTIIVGIFLTAMVYIWVWLSPHHAPATFRTPPGLVWPAACALPAAPAPVLSATRVASC